MHAQARASVLTAAQCATYNESKKLWMWMTGGGDDLATHIGSSMITGLVTTKATGPVEVIKTKMFVGAPPLTPAKAPMYCVLLHWQRCAGHAEIVHLACRCRLTFCGLCNACLRVA